MAFVLRPTLACAIPIMCETWAAFVCRHIRLCVEMDCATVTTPAHATMDSIWSRMGNSAFQSVQKDATMATALHRKNALAILDFHCQSMASVNRCAARDVKMEIASRQKFANVIVDTRWLMMFVSRFARGS